MTAVIAQQSIMQYLHSVVPAEYYNTTTHGLTPALNKAFYLNLLLMSEILQAFWVSNPILSTSFLNHEVTCSPAKTAVVWPGQRRCSCGSQVGRMGDRGSPGLHSSPCCSFSPAYTSMHQAWKAKEKRSSKREGGCTTALRRLSHSWHCSKVENWHLETRRRTHGQHASKYEQSNTWSFTVHKQEMPPYNINHHL